MSYMSHAVVTRSIRVDADFDAKIQAVAAEEGTTVSGYMRDVIAEDLARRDRQRRRERALEMAAKLGDLGFDRDAAWGIGDRIPG